MKFEIILRQCFSGMGGTDTRWPKQGVRIVCCGATALAFSALSGPSRGGPFDYLIAILETEQISTQSLLDEAGAANRLPKR